MNLPNKLSLLRVILAPVFVVVVVLPLPSVVWRVLAAAIFILTSLTDMLDGMIARKCNMVTDFGKFIDPLADKFMVFCALISLLFKSTADDQGFFSVMLLVATLIVIFRELAITSLRLLVSSNSGVVIAAGWLGKVKTVTQILCILMIILEPIIVPVNLPISGSHLFSYILMAAMCIMTVWSGINYVKAYWHQLDPTK